MIKIKNTQVRVIKHSLPKSVLSSKCVSQELLVRNAARQAIVKACKLKKKAIDLPVFSAGDLPLNAVAKITAQEVWRVLHHDGYTGIKQINFCTNTAEEYAVFTRTALGYLDYIAHKLKSPFVTVDAIIELKEGIVIIKRSNPPYGWALPGGFVDYAESLEQAVIREAKEETGLNIRNIVQMHTYSDPSRDPRFHTVGTVFIAQAKGKPCAGDDAADIKVISPGKIYNLDFAFDHKKILLDYLKLKNIIPAA